MAQWLPHSRSVVHTVYPSFHFLFLFKKYFTVKKICLPAYLIIITVSSAFHINVRIKKLCSLTFCVHYIGLLTTDVVRCGVNVIQPQSGPATSCTLQVWGLKKTNNSFFLRVHQSSKTQHLLSCICLCCSHSRHIWPLSRLNIFTWFVVMNFGLLGFFFLKRNQITNHQLIRTNVNEL